VKHIPESRLGFKQLLALLAGFAFCASLADASGITFTCATGGEDPDTFATGTCAYLNSAVSALYGSLFSNANASVYVSMGGASPLSGNDTSKGSVTYAQYAAALAASAAAGGDPIQIAAAASLGPSGAANAVYGNSRVNISTALAQALGISADMNLDNGFTASGSQCSPIGSPGCYNGLITIANPKDVANATGNGLYFGSGDTPSGDYNFYSLVEQQTNEILGMYSCVGTNSAVLKNACSGSLENLPSADDLFRYSGPGSIATVTAAVGRVSDGYAYFSYDGGATNGADGLVYNTSVTGNAFTTDPSGAFADFTANCVGGLYSVQDDVACAGTDYSLLSDGGADLNVLDAIGYEEPMSVPEPGTLFLCGAGIIAVFAYRRARRA